MHTSGSVLYTVLERLRFQLQESGLDKYDNDYLLRHVIMPELAESVALLNLGDEDPVVLTTEIAVTEGMTEYQLPPMIGEIRKIVALSDDGRVMWDWRPQAFNHRWGPGWRIENRNLIIFDPPIIGARTWTMFFIPSGDGTLAYGEAGDFIDADTKGFTLGAALLGQLDKRNNGHAGMVLRILQANTWEEKIINTFDPVTGIVTFKTDLQYTVPEGTPTIIWEICFPGYQTLIDMVVFMCCVNLAGARNISTKLMTFFDHNLARKRKSVRDRLRTVQTRVGTHVEVQTGDAYRDDFDPFSGLNRQ